MPPEEQHCSWFVLAWLAWRAVPPALRCDDKSTHRPPMELVGVRPEDVQRPAARPSVSPVTVTHEWSPDERHSAPYHSQRIRAARAEATDALLRAYCQLVRGPPVTWAMGDIPEATAERSLNYRDVVVRSPEQDALGVLAGANAVMCNVLNDDFIVEHCLDLEMRYWLAAILFVVYKLKTGEVWMPGECLTVRVLEQFLSAQELGDWRSCEQRRREHEICMWDAEAFLVAYRPLHQLVNCGVHGAFEVACTQLMEVGSLTGQQGTLAVGVVHFYLHAAYASTNRDLIGELVSDRCVGEVGASLALVVLVAARLNHGWEVSPALDLDGVRDLWPYDRLALTDAALQFVRNAWLFSQRKPLGGACIHPEAVVYDYVKPKTLAALMNALSG